MTINQFKNLMAADLVINEWRSAPNTGWIIKPASGIQIVHRPTGAMVQVDTERSQHKNKMIALEMLDKKVGIIMEARASQIDALSQAWDIYRDGKDLPLNDVFTFASGFNLAQRAAPQQHAQAAQPAKQYGLAAYAQANADSRVTGNAQAALSYEQRQNLELVIARLEQIAEHPVRHIDTKALAEQALPCARAILAGQQPVAAPVADLTRLTRFHHPYVVDGKPTVRNAVWLDDVVAMLDAEGFSAPVATAIQAEPLSQPAAAGNAGAVELPPFPSKTYLGGDEAFGDVITGYTEESMCDFYQQGRASGLEEAAKALNNAGFGGECFDAAIRALNKTGAV